VEIGGVSPDFIPVIAAYAGNNLSNLTEITSGTNLIAFRAVAGSTYQIAIDSPTFANSSGEFDLGLGYAPVNDDFANRIHVGGTQVSWSGTTVHASREVGESLAAGSREGASVWYAWTASVSGTVILARNTESIGLPVAVYAGSTLSNLLLLAVAPNVEDYYAARFYALAGTTYQIAVSDNDGNEDGFTLTLNAGPALPAVDATSARRSGDGTFRMNILGVNGQSFAVQTSTNLLDWTTVMIDTLLGNSQEWIDIDTASGPWRFYRAVGLEAVLGNPQMHVRAGQFDGSGTFSVRVLGSGGQPFMLQASTNLMNWIEIKRDILIGDLLDFRDPHSASVPERFYRALPLQ
jgi:hypothetical protein